METGSAASAGFNDSTGAASVGTARSGGVSTASLPPFTTASVAGPTLAADLIITSLAPVGVIPFSMSAGSTKLAAVAKIDFVCSAPVGASMAALMPEGTCDSISA